jgi:hypothetical protein
MTDAGHYFHEPAVVARCSRGHRVGEYFTYDDHQGWDRGSGAPGWLAELAERRPKFIGEDRATWPGVVIAADDTVRRSDDPVRW